METVYNLENKNTREETRKSWYAFMTSAAMSLSNATSTISKYLTNVQLSKQLSIFTHLKPLVYTLGVELVITGQHPQELAGLKVAHTYHTPVT